MGSSMLAVRARQACASSPSLHVLLCSRKFADAPKRDVTATMAADRFLDGTYTERQNQMKRPISPHVAPKVLGGEGFIYKLPLVAWSSLMTRGTGILLSVGMTG